MHLSKSSACPLTTAVWCVLVIIFTFPQQRVHSTTITYDSLIQLRDIITYTTISDTQPSPCLLPGRLQNFWVQCKNKFRDPIYFYSWTDCTKVL